MDKVVKVVHKKDLGSGALLSTVGQADFSFIGAKAEGLGIAVLIITRVAAHKSGNTGKLIHLKVPPAKL